MGWVENDLKDHLVSTPLPWTGTPSTRPGKTLHVGPSVWSVVVGKL